MGADRLRPCPWEAFQSEWMSVTGSSSGESWTTSRSSWTWTSSTQSVGGPRAGETGGGSTSSPTGARILRNGAGSVMNEMRRMSPPQAGHASGNASAIRGEEFGPRDPGGVVETLLRLGVGRASGLTRLPQLTGRLAQRLPGIPDRQRRHEWPQRMIRRKHPVIPMPVSSRWRHQVRKAI